MYLAEIHGKIPSQLAEREDVLTSNVFSLLKYADRRVFLRGYLASIGIDVSDGDAENAVFIFWPSLPGLEPDLVLIVGDFYVMFEAKFRSGLAPADEPDDVQLSREIRQGLKEAASLGKAFRMVYVTADYVHPVNTLRHLPASLSAHLRWANWQQADLFVRQVLAITQLPVHEAEFADDLTNLLDQKGLRSFHGVHLPVTSKLATLDSVFYRHGTTARHGLFTGFRDLRLTARLLLKRAPQERVLVVGLWFDKIAVGGIRSASCGPVFFAKEGV